MLHNAAVTCLMRRLKSEVSRVFGMGSGGAEGEGGCGMGFGSGGGGEGFLNETGRLG